MSIVISRDVRLSFTTSKVTIKVDSAATSDTIHETGFDSVVIMTVETVAAVDMPGGAVVIRTLALVTDTAEEMWKWIS